MVAKSNFGSLMWNVFVRFKLIIISSSSSLSSVMKVMSLKLDRGLSCELFSVLGQSSAFRKAVATDSPVGVVIWSQQRLADRPRGFFPSTLPVTIISSKLSGYPAGNVTEITEDYLVAGC